MNTTNPPSKRTAKGQTRRQTPQKRTLKKINPKSKNKPVCPLYGTGHDINLCKVMMAQAKATKSIWSTACGGGADLVKFQCTKKRPSKAKELNDLVSNAVI